VFGGIGGFLFFDVSFELTFLVCVFFGDFLG
jgi:hypothetical protein